MSHPKHSQSDPLAGTKGRCFHIVIEEIPLLNSRPQPICLIRRKFQITKKQSISFCVTYTVRFTTKHRCSNSGSFEVNRSDTYITNFVVLFFDNVTVTKLEIPSLIFLHPEVLAVQQVVYPDSVMSTSFCNVQILTMFYMCNVNNIYRHKVMVNNTKFHILTKK